MKKQTLMDEFTAKKIPMLGEFERMLRQFGNRRYDPATDTYRNDRRKDCHPIKGELLREAAAKAENEPDRWATFFKNAINGSL